MAGMVHVHKFSGQQSDELKTQETGRLLCIVRSKRWQLLQIACFTFVVGYDPELAVVNWPHVDINRVVNENSDV